VNQAELRLANRSGAVAIAPQSGGMTPETELLFFEASRTQLVREVIKPALEVANASSPTVFSIPRPFIKGRPQLDRKLSGN